jgi:hypothetical protein
MPRPLHFGISSQFAFLEIIVRALWNSYSFSFSQVGFQTYVTRLLLIRIAENEDVKIERSVDAAPCVSTGKYVPTKNSPVPLDPELALRSFETSVTVHQ